MNAGVTDREDGAIALAKILRLPVEYHDDLGLRAEATAIALRLNAGAAYDAHDLALAVRLDLTFYTADAKLYGPARPHFPMIELVPVE